MTTQIDHPSTEWVSYQPRPEDAHGLKLIEMSFREQVARIIKPAPKDHDINWQITKVFDEYGTYLDAREAQAKASRLAGLRQHGLKSNRDPIGNVFPVNRFHHSRIVAAYALVFALCARRTVKEAMEACEGGWRHDADHPAYCHTAEHLITKEPFNVDEHEERSLSSALNDRSLVEFTLKNSLHLGNIVDAMRERGRFPTQSPADTTGYTEHDGIFIGDTLPEDYGWRIASSILGAENSRLIVDDPGPLLNMLERRAHYHQKHYSSRKGRIVDAATMELFRFAIQMKIFSAQDLVREVDAFVDKHMLDMLTGVRSVPEHIASLMKIARGDLTELAQWEQFAFTSKGDYLQRFNALATWRKDLLPVPTRVLDEKTIDIISTSGVHRALKANIPLNPEDTTYLLFTYKR